MQGYWSLHKLPATKEKLLIHSQMPKVFAGHIIFFVQVFEAFYISFVNSFFEHLTEEDRAKLHNDLEPFLVGITKADTHEDLEYACHSIHQTYGTLIFFF